MKLRGIELSNVRRFAGRRAILSDLGDGVTVLSEPNEFGKSTFFDALHALFFERHRSTRAPVKALQPHAGGAPEIAAEIDLPDGRFRIHKRFLSRPQARITDAQGRLIAQEDEAEAWIDRLMGGDLAGPSGLLWVRQGLLGLEPEGASADERRERERGLGARRHLLSSVAGEIDMMTGGRRMDLVLARVGAEMARLATATGRPKAGGEWARALDEAAGLAVAEAEARDKAQRLSGDLDRRAEVLRRLARLTEPAAAGQRAQALAEAQAAHQAARAHADRTLQAERDLKLARLDEAGAVQRIDQLRHLTLRIDQAGAARAKAEDRAAAARARAEDLALRDRRAAADHQAAAEITRGLRARLAAAQRARLAQAAETRAADLARAVERAEALQWQMQSDRAERARLTVTPKALVRLEEAQVALDRALARAEAQAVSIEALPEGPPATGPDGTALDAGPQPVLVRTTLHLPGFGALIVDPGAGQGAAAAGAVAAARDGLTQALSECAVESLPEARRQQALAQRLDDALHQGRLTLTDLAPDGLEALRLAHATAAAEAERVPVKAEDPAPLEVQLTAAEAVEAEAQAAAQGAHEAAVAAGEARADGEGERRSAERALVGVLDEAGAPQDLAERLAALQRDLPALTARSSAAALQLQDLIAAAPDLTTAEAALARAGSAADQARRDLDQLRQELAALNTRIEILAEEGIEELRDDLTGRRMAAEARAARLEAEMAALSRLRLALDQARTRQRDAYFRPVLRELQPLLAILHPGAALQIDDDSLLPHALTRDGQVEALDILSGGTREQVAILTRLAFARLFAQADRPVPVILDDALVHSDDDRIEAMFTALHRVAADQQVLVLTCRQRAFESLGGTRAQVRVEPL